MVYVIPFIFIVAVNYFPTNTPRVFHVEKTHKWLFPRCFNVEYMWCVCRVSSNLQDLFVSCLHKTFISYHCFWKMIYLTSNCSKFSMFLMVTHSYKSFFNVHHQLLHIFIIYQFSKHYATERRAKFPWNLLKRFSKRRLSSETLFVHFW